MRFYVASKYENAERVHELVDLLRRLGFECTRDWTQPHDGLHWDWDEEGATERLAPTTALADSQAVRDCDVFIMLTYNDTPMIGALVELGIAIALHKEIYIVGEQPKNIFAYLPGVQVVDHIGVVLANVIDKYQSSLVGGI